MLQVNMILGYSDETEESLKQTEDFLAKINPDICRTFFFTPFPGSRAYEDLRKENRIVEKNWLFYSVDNPELLFKHEYLNRKILLKHHLRIHYRHLLRSFFDVKKLLKIVKLALKKPTELLKYLFSWTRFVFGLSSAKRQ